MSIALVVLALVTINFLMAASPVQGRPAALINCSGSIQAGIDALFFNTVTNTIGLSSGGHSLVGDPKFVDPLHDDYYLQFGSAAIDHGVDAGVHTDLDGLPRPKGLGFDLGAYEYQNIRYLWLPVARK